MPVTGGSMYMFEYANLDYITTVVEDPIIQNKWYTALAETDNVKAYYLIVEQTAQAQPRREKPPGSRCMQV